MELSKKSFPIEDPGLWQDLKSILTKKTKLWHWTFENDSRILNFDSSFHSEFELVIFRLIKSFLFDYLIKSFLNSV